MAQQQVGYHAGDGAAYEVWLGRWARPLADAFLAFAALPESGALLDVGCGTGALTLRMAERWPERDVIGVDVAAPFIAYAQSRRSGGRPAFELGDASALDYENGRFAAVTSQLLLVFVPKPEVALREMRRVTRSGGTVAAVVWDFRGGLVFQRMVWDTAAVIDPAARAVRDRLFASPVANPGGLAGCFRDAGFEAVEERSLTVRAAYADFEDYWQSFLAGQGPVGAYFTQLASDTRARLKEAVGDAYRSGSPDGVRSMAASAWAVRARVP